MWHLCQMYSLWHNPNLLYRLKCESKVKATEKQRIGAHSLIRNTSGGKGACWSFGMGTRKSGKHQLLTRTCTNQTTSWLVHGLSTFGARTNHEQTQTHKTHHGLNLGEATTFPLIVYYVPLHKVHIQMAFCFRTPKWESQNSQTWDSRDFGGP
jgi:hypothetical protein